MALAAVALACAAYSSSGADAVAASEADGAARILYASDASYPSNEIYIADPTGRKSVGRLTFGNTPPCRRWIGNYCGWDAPEPSPDGRKVLMWFRHQSDVPGPATATLFVSRADGRGRIPIVRNVPVCRCQAVAAAWSPDSRYIAYRSSEQWHVVGADGASDDSLVLPAWVPDLRLSPDRRWIVTKGERDLTLNDTRRASRRTFAIRVDEFAWSADSRRLGISAADGGLYVLETPSLRLRRLTADRGYDLDWSPDARSLAYLARSPTNGNEAGDLRVVDLQGRVKTVVDAAGDRGGVISDLAWTRVPTGTTYRQPPVRFPSGDGTVTLPWDIDRLATDGERVALISCGHVFVWSPTRREVLQAENQASLTQRCNGPGFYSPTRLFDLAIAGNRVAWGYHEGNTGQSAELFVSSLGSERNLTSLGRGRGQAGGPWRGIGELAGSGEMLAYSTWAEDCVPATNCRRFVTREQSLRLAGTSGCPCPVLRSEPGPFVPFAVDGGRIVAGGDNALIVLDSSGAELLSIPVQAAAASLSGRDLVVVVQGTLRHHDAETGALLHAWPIPNVASGQRCATPNQECVHPALVLEDTERGLVTYVVGKQVHVLRLEDGADVVVSPGQTSGFIESGLVLAVGPRLRLVRYGDLPIR